MEMHNIYVHTPFVLSSWKINTIESEKKKIDKERKREIEGGNVLEQQSVEQ